MAKTMTCQAQALTLNRRGPYGSVELTKLGLCAFKVMEVVMAVICAPSSAVALAVAVPPAPLKLELIPSVAVASAIAVPFPLPDPDIIAEEVVWNNPSVVSSHVSSPK